MKIHFESGLRLKGLKMSVVNTRPRQHMLKPILTEIRPNSLVIPIIPTYNRAAVLDRAIDSALDQTYEDMEVIVDDGSTDNTESVVRAFDDDRLRYVYQENAGANAALNRGIRLASGKYVSFFDSDDELHPEHVERL